MRTRRIITLLVSWPGWLLVCLLVTGIIIGHGSVMFSGSSAEVNAQAPRLPASGAPADSAQAPLHTLTPTATSGHATATPTPTQAHATATPTQAHATATPTPTHVSATATPTASATPTPGSTLTATPTPTPTFTVTIPSFTDLSVSVVDLNQAVANYRTVPYVPDAPVTMQGGGGIVNKDAILRVFVRVPTPTPTPPSQSSGQGLNVPFSPQVTGVSGTVTGYPCNSSTPLGTLTPINPGGTITARISPRPTQLNDSLNFRLPQSWITGCLNLTITITSPPGIEDSSMLANNTLYWNVIQFVSSRPINLILAPYFHVPSGRSADILASPAFALQWINNAYPLPGNFLQDSLGINLIRMLPMQTTSRNMSTDKGGFLNDVRNLLTNLQSQGNLPADVRLLGMVPCGCGGMADMPGGVSFGDTWAQEAGPLPVGQDSPIWVYGQIWAQEIAHNFGRNHAGNWHGEAGGGGFDPNYPYFHGWTLLDGLAINTLWWRGSPYIIPAGTPYPDGSGAHAHDFMSYGGPPWWVSPYTYNGLYNDINSSSAAAAAQAPARLASPIEQLVAVGQIHSDDSVELQPFYRVNTDFVSSPGTTGEFSLELLDANGVVLIAHRFDAQRVTHEDALSFAEFVPWQVSARRIVLKRNDVPLAERAVSAHTPTVRVLSPNGGETLGMRTTIAWEAGDADGDALSYTVLYNTGADTTWWPIATNVTTTTLDVDTSLLPGSAQGRIRVRATDGVNTAEDNSDGTFIVPEKSPVIGIVHPIAGEMITEGTDANLIGAAYDAEDGFLSDDNLTWTSHVDGEIGHGHHAHTTSLSPGAHTITLSVMDSQGRQSTVQVNIFVGHRLHLPLLLKR